MEDFNKMEKLLDKMVAGTKIFVDGHVLLFVVDFQGENETQLYFDKYSDSNTMHLNFIKVRENKDNQFKFDLPLSYIQNFLDKYNKNAYGITEKPAAAQIDSTYNQLLNQVNNCPKFTSLILHAALECDLEVNTETSDKKIKI